MVATNEKNQSRNALVETLRANFEVFRDCRPLALGIHKIIMERMPQVEAAQLRLAMRIHTSSTRYLKTLLTGKERFNLDAEPMGEISEEQREIARTTLRERFEKSSQRRRAEANARLAARREQEALQQHQKKLAQLAAHFSRR